MLDLQLGAGTSNIETRRTVLDIAIQKYVTDLLLENINDRLTQSLIKGMAKSITVIICDNLQATSIPVDIIETIAALEAENIKLLEELENVRTASKPRRSRTAKVGGTVTKPVA